MFLIKQDFYNNFVFCNRSNLFVKKTILIGIFFFCFVLNDLSTFNFFAERQRSFRVFRFNIQRTNNVAG